MAGRSTSAAISLFILVFLAFAIIRHRKSVASWMIDTLAAPDAGVAEGAGTTNGIAQPPKAPRGAALVRNWYWFALAYLLFIFGTVMAGSTTALVEAVTGSGKIAAALILASVLSRYLTNSMSSGVHLPDEVNLKLPLLERRLNAFVPKALFVLRYVLLAIVLLFALDVIGALSLRSWLESQIGLQLTTKLLSVATIVLVITLIWLAVTSWVDYRLNPDYGSIPTAREMTLLSLFRNAATIVLLAFGLMFSLSEIGLDIGPLLASAGVLGLAIGFGAQKMVQDIITGVFIQFENAINVGDVITVGGITGGVEKLSVRSVSLRDVHGVFHIIPFSSVDMVSNFTREFSYFVCDMGIAYRENVEEAKQAMFDAYEQLRQDEDQAPFLLGDLEWFGLNTFGDSAVVVRARIKTLPGKQWGVGRAYNGLLKTIFDERGIEIPFPHQTIYFGESKGGTTQTLNISAEPSMDVSD
jgi:small-conductance mechanosensitive channel